MHVARARLVTILVMSSVATNCRAAGPVASAAPSIPTSRDVREGILLSPTDGEPRFLGLERLPTLIKVDSATVGAEQLFVFQRTLDPGASLGHHRHVQDDEIIFVHAGELVATLGGQARAAPAGATLFVPAGAWMNLENRGSAPAVIVVVFASPHMAAYIRALGTPVGAPKQALTDSELRSLAARHHVEFAAP